MSATGCAVPCEVMSEIYASQNVRDRDGAAHPLGGGSIKPAYAEALYRTLLAHRPQVVLEVGMAYGLSSLAIAAALKQNGQGKLISIDPVQSSTFKGIGRLNVERAGMGQRHELVELPDYQALPKLLEAGTRIQFGYIDGWHTFDYTLLDFFYVDRMLDAGGVVALNDCGYRAVHKVIKFILSHRRYSEMDVGLARDFKGRNALTSLHRRLTGRSSSDRYFLKNEDWEPDWNFFAPF